jgi:Ca2+-binding RTX toxin-like protein
VAGFEILIGTSKNDILTGNSLVATTIQGGAGNDTIKGGTAIDTFSGGAGNDTFVFINSGQGKDVFTDFANGDRLQINGTNFGGGLPGAGSLPDASWLVVGAAPVETIGVNHGQFLYNTTNDTLYWDVDGGGINDSPVEIGQFGSSVVLKLADFTLVV